MPFFYLLYLQDQKRQVKGTSQRLKRVLDFLERSLLRAKVTKKEKQKETEEREGSLMQQQEVPKPKPKDIPAIVAQLVNPPVGVGQ